MRFARHSIALVLLSVSTGFVAASEDPDAASSYDELLVLFADWRAFESPPLLNGAPDYTTQQFAARRADYIVLRERLDAFQIGGRHRRDEVDVTGQQRRDPWCGIGVLGLACRGNPARSVPLSPPPGVIGELRFRGDARFLHDVTELIG